MEASTECRVGLNKSMSRLTNVSEQRSRAWHRVAAGIGGDVAQPAKVKQVKLVNAGQQESCRMSHGTSVIWILISNTVRKG